MAGKKKTPEEWAKETFDKSKAFLCNVLHMPGWMVDWWAAWPAEIIYSAAVVLPFLLDVYIAVFGPVAEDLLEAIDTARQESGSIIGRLSVGVLNELFAGTLSPDDLATTTDAAGMLKRAEQVGKKFRDALLSEFVKGSSVTPQSGYDAAATFSGFAVNFATGTAFVAVLADALSFGHFEQFRELGVTTTRNLGLGRMQARAWRAIIDEVINKPAQRFVLAKYRTTIPKENGIVQL